MQLKPILLIPIILISQSCQQKVVHKFEIVKKKYSDYYLPPKYVAIPDSNYVILKNSVRMDLSSTEIKQIHKMISECLYEYNDSIIKSNINSEADIPTIDISYYKQQYFPILNTYDNGEKQIYVNCLCFSLLPKNWKTQFYSMSDGGSCFFNLVINLTKKSYSNFKVNSNG